jgi:hypothetical protein
MCVLTGGGLEVCGMDPIVMGVMLDRTVLGLAWLAERTSDPHERDVLALAAGLVERELESSNATNRAAVRAPVA